MADLDFAKPLIDLDGNIAYLTPDTLEVYDITGADLNISGVLVSGYSDLGEPSIDKLLNYIDVDYIGECLITFSFTGLDGTSFNSSVITLPLASARTTSWIQLPLDERKPFQKMRYFLQTLTQGTIIYGMEIDFSILNRRRFH